MVATLRWTHLKTTLHIVHRSTQNIVLGVDLQLDVAFRVFYGARFVPVHTVL